LESVITPYIPLNRNGVLEESPLNNRP